MKKFSTVVLICIGSFQVAFAQQVIHACCDTLICLPGTPIPLSCVVDSGSTGTVLNIADDTYSQLVNLGFSFTFFGNTYTQCVLSTNAYITFNTNLANGYSPWVIANAAPSSVNPLNAVYGPWHDVDPAVPPYGTLGFGTFGTAPNRFFVYNFCSVPYYQCNDTLFTGQIILYETSNIIEIHLGHKDICAGWNAGAAIEGLQDKTGSVAYIVPGRNYPTQWTAYNDAYRFTPNGNAYTMDPIAYAPVPFAAGTPVWSTLDGQYVATGYNITVTPDSTTTYIVTTASCGFSADTVTVTLGAIPAQFDTIALSCIGSNDGSASIVPTDGHAPYTYVWTDQAGDTVLVNTTNGGDTISQLPIGSYTVNYTNGLGCTGSHTFTITQPVYNAAFSYSPGLVCDGATVTFTDNSNGNISGYQWDFGDGTTSTLQNPTHQFAAPGSYNVTLTINLPPNCTATATQVIDVHENITGSMAIADPPYCTGQPIQFTGNAVGQPSQWNWSFGDGASATQQNPVHSFSDQGDYTIYFSVTDSFCGTANDSTVIMVYQVPDPHLRSDTDLCEGTIIYLESNDSSGTYLWSTGETTYSINYQMPADAIATVTVTVDNNGCKGTDTLQLTNNCFALLPDAFSPNGDGRNDLFRPIISNARDFDFKIFNRWGQVVYADNSGNTNNGWDGKVNGVLQPIGVYVFVLTGHFDSGKEFSLHGNVTLVR